MTHAAAVLLLGDSRLRLKSEVVNNFSDQDLRATLNTLRNTLLEFRLANGFGRAMAAPQIGVLQRIIVLHWEGATSFLINPEYTWLSEAKRTLWDDCMSIPGLMVRVARHESISVRFQDENGAFHEWNNIAFDLAELIQHEMDHLDGILATDRAIDRDSLVAREQFMLNRNLYFSQVDHVIASYANAR